MTQPAVQHWSAVTVAGNEPFDELYLWLAGQLDGFARLSGDEDAIEAGVVNRGARYNAATLVDGDSLAYLAPIRPVADGARYEFGVRAHGPDGDRLAATLIHQVQQWDHGPRGHRAHIEVYPAEAPLPQHPATRIVDRAHTRVLLTWPTSPASANLSS